MIGDRVEELRRQLREAELSSAVERTSGRLSIVSATDDSERPRLGPTVFVDVEVNEVKTIALVDTSATIISLDFVLQVLADQRDQRLTPVQWKEKTLQRFSSPEVSLTSYGGHGVDIVAQIPLRLKLSNKCTDAVVLVQKGAPNQLLLGTDVQPRLGIALIVQEYDLLAHKKHGPPRQEVLPSRSGNTECVKKTRTGSAATTVGHGGLQTCPDFEKSCKQPVYGHTQPVNESKSCNPSPTTRRKKSCQSNLLTCVRMERETSMDSPATTTAEIRLLQTVKVPAGYRKIARGLVQGDVGDTLLLFTSTVDIPDLLLADGALEGGGDGCRTLILENHATEKLWLEKGMVLGTVTPVDEVKIEDRPDIPEGDSHGVAGMDGPDIAQHSSTPTATATKSMATADAPQEVDIREEVVDNLTCYKDVADDTSGQGVVVHQIQSGSDRRE